MGDLQLAEVLPKKTCGGCSHWRRGWIDWSEGYASAICSLEGELAPRERRASETCSSWTKYEKSHGELLLF